ncbi:MAG: TrmH family RNA methyltransferase [Planctomycetota bacterium]
MSQPVESITSAANPRIKALATLRRKGASADDSRILIDGHREITRAAQAGLAMQELYLCRALLHGDDHATLVNELQTRGVWIIDVPEHVFEKIRYGDRAGGLVAVAQRPHRTLADLRLSAAPLLAIVEHVGKPGNLGAILRSADGAGVEAVLVVDSAIDVYGPNVIRAGVATIFRIPVVELTAADAAAFLATNSIQIVAASPDGRTDYTQLDYRRPTAFVFGAEDRGLSAAWTGQNITAARIPMKGIGDSLNVSTTAALFFYEAVRQRAAR